MDFDDIADRADHAREVDREQLNPPDLCTVVDAAGWPCVKQGPHTYHWNGGKTPGGWWVA